MTQPSGAADESLAQLHRFMREHHRDELELLDRLKSSYMRTGRDGMVKGHLDSCLKLLATRSATGARHEVRGFILIGDTGSGKSHLARRLLSHHPLFPGFGTPGSGCPAISIAIPGSCNLKVLGIQILRATGYPIVDGKEHIVWDKVRTRIKDAGVLVLHLDEINNLVGTTSHEVDRKITNSFKALLNRPDWPVILLLSGTPACEPILRGDEELARRMDWLHLAPMVAPRDNAMIAKQVSAFCSIANIAAPKRIETVLAPKIVLAANGRLGVMMELCQDAVAMAASDGASTLTGEHFARALARRTGCTAADNPFVVAIWRAEKDGDATLGADPLALGANDDGDEQGAGEAR